MAHRFIADLKAGERIDDEVFLIRSKDLRTTTQGSLYIHAVLVDQSGQMVARAWQATESMFYALPEGGFIRLKGRTESYKGSLQFIIDAIRPVDSSEINMADFLPTTDKDIDAMWSRLVEILGQVKHAELKALIQEFLSDHELMERFRQAPAAFALHHAYVGGLLEHTVNLLELCLRVVPLYAKLSMDLMLTGLFLHDIGKARELSYDTAIGYTDEGQLVGHLVMATLWLDKKADIIAEKSGKPFPERLRWALQHIVLSHHGKYEFGSPRLPAFPEAVAIHYLDNLDAKIGMFLAEIENSRDPDTNWTNFNRAVETKIYKPDIMGVRGDTAE
ncbi:MAG: HD domain-containing protein [Phycisphaerales bacterium]|nr:MAG: HD domain-containing protein [Phycisphaerales bacterium]